MGSDGLDHRTPESVATAVDLLADLPDAELVLDSRRSTALANSERAGSVTLVDVSHLDALSGIERVAGEESDEGEPDDGESDEGDPDHGEPDHGTIRVGAATPVADLANHDAVRTAATAVAEASSAVDDDPTGGRATVGATLAAPEPESALPAAALATGATVRVHRPDGEHAVSVDDFFDGANPASASALESGFVTALELPRGSAVSASAYEKKPSLASGDALVGVAARLTADGDTVTDARVAANGVTREPVRIEGVEAALAGATLDAGTPEAVAQRAGDRLAERTILADQRASARFRRQLLGAYTERAVESAAGRAGLL